MTFKGLKTLKWTWVVCEGRHNRWTLLACANCISSIDMHMWTMTILGNQHWLSRGNITQEKWTIAEKFSVDPPIYTVSKQCVWYSSLLKFPGGNFLREYTIIEGKMLPEAETHERTLWVFPFSADVTAYTLQQPSSATTLPGLWTMLTPVTSML